jgi:DNA-binding NtrC family response regulator
MNPGARIGAAEIAAVLPGLAEAAGASEHLADAVRAFERRQIEAAIRAEGGNMTRAAERLGLERSHLYKKMKQLGLGEPGG